MPTQMPPALFAVLDYSGVAVFAYLLLQTVVDRTAAGLLGMAGIAAIRLGAIAWNWTLPVFSVLGPEDR